jgi:hypothetical protein
LGSALINVVENNSLSDRRAAFAGFLLAETNAKECGFANAISTDNASALAGAK